MQGHPGYICIPKYSSPYRFFFDTKTYRYAPGIVSSSRDPTPWALIPPTRVNLPLRRDEMAPSPYFGTVSKNFSCCEDVGWESWVTSNKFEILWFHSKITSGELGKATSGGQARTSNHSVSRTPRSSEAEK